MKTQGSPASLRRQLGMPLLLLGLAGTALAVLIAAFLLYQLNNQFLHKGVTYIAHSISSHSARALSEMDRKAALETLSILRNTPNISPACLYLADGYLYGTYPQTTDACPQKIDINLYHKGRMVDTLQDLVAYMPVIRDDKLLGLLSIHLSKRFVYMQIGGMLLIIALIALAGFMLAYWLIQRFFVQTLAPLTQLGQTAQQVTQTPQAMPMPRIYTQRKDELGTLINSFNYMLDTLEEKQQALTQSEARFRLLTESSPMGILSRNERFDAIFLNQRLQMLIGQPGVKQITRSQWMEGLAEEDLPRFLNFQQRMLDLQQPGSLEYHFRPLGQQEFRVFIEHLVALDQGSDQPPLFVGSIMDITDVKRAQEQLEYQALFDSLTGLPNRQHCKNVLQAELDQRQSDNKPMALMFLDLDNFKKINDTLGHDTGDQVLTHAATRLQNCLHMLDVFIARMGGDEFVILLRQAKTDQDIQFCANIITRRFNQPLHLDGLDVDISFSIGIAVFPQHGNEVEQLLKHADIALYEAKQAGRNRSCLFNDDMLHSLQRQQKIQHRLRKALQQPAKAGVSLAFQPQYHLQEQRFRSGECLCRWKDAQLGQVPADQFIPVAEESGLILPLGEWVINEACRLFKQHQQSLNAMGIHRIAINLSARQFFDSNLIHAIEQVLKRHGLSGENLEIELTESILLDDLELTIGIMSGMRDAGMHIAIDDFGTGFSSLSYLKQLPITALKIDRTFIRDIPADPQDMEITAAIIAMAHKLELTTVAEGVEDQTQLDFLTQQGCDLVQGYLLAKPMPLEAFLQQQQDA